MKYILLLLCLLLSGCAVVNDDSCTHISTGNSLSFSEAKLIAQNSECLEKGSFKENHFCNENTGTWWIDLKMKPEFHKDICNPACVISVDSKAAEINWRCTGTMP